jgi:hypothetical protein
VRFLADEQFPHGLVDRLVRLGHDIVEVASTRDLVGTDEVEVLLPWAKRRQRVLSSGDHFEDRNTRMRLHEHLRRTGRGRIIIVTKASSMPPLKSLAKLLYHLDEIDEFFASGHGLVRIGDLQNVRFFRPADLTWSGCRLRKDTSTSIGTKCDGRVPRIPTSAAR